MKNKCLFSLFSLFGIIFLLIAITMIVLSTQFNIFLSYIMFPTTWAVFFFGRIIIDNKNMADSLGLIIEDYKWLQQIKQLENFKKLLFAYNTSRIDSTSARSVIIAKKYFDTLIDIKTKNKSLKIDFENWLDIF